MFGLALTVVAATGTFIWLNKRARRGIAVSNTRALWWGFVIGVPVAMLVTLAARLGIGNDAPFGAIFWSVMAVILVAALIIARRSGERLQVTQEELVPAE